MIERQVELARIEVGVAYDRYHAGDMVLRISYEYDGGKVTRSTRRVPLGAAKAVVRCWDRLFDEVLRAQHQEPQELQLTINPRGMGEWLPRLDTLVRIVAYELKVPLEEADTQVPAMQLASSPASQEYELVPE